MAQNEPSGAPVGIGGWLSLLALGVGAQPFLGLISLAETLKVFEDDTWRMLTDPGSPRYLPMWGPLVVFELVGSAGFIVAGCALAYLFFKKRRAFPRSAIVFMSASAVFVILDLVLGALVVGTSPEPKAIAEPVRSVAASAIWIPYLVRSRRVAATFVT